MTHQFCKSSPGYWPSDVIAAEDGKTARGIVAVEMCRLGISGSKDFRGKYSFRVEPRHDVININRNGTTNLRFNACRRNGAQREQRKPQRRKHSFIESHLITNNIFV